MTSVAWMVGLFVVSFLLGSIPWGVVISRLFFHKDIRSEGSGNIGTTNAMRTMGKKGGIAVFALDFAKGVLSGVIALVVASHLVAAEPYEAAGIAAALGAGAPADVEYKAAMMAAGGVTVPALCSGLAFLGCIWGHIFSPWLKFKGGKGIAVAVGAMIPLFGIVWTLPEIAIFAVLVVATRYVSVGSLAAAVLCPIIAAYLFLAACFQPVTFACCTVAALTVIWAHRGNIRRLAAGEERRIGDKKKEKGASEA